MTPTRFNKIKSVLTRRQPDLTVVMENVHKPHNLAAIARSCDAVGINEVHAIPYSDEIAIDQKASVGCERWVALKTHETVDDAFSHLRERGFKILATHFSSEAINFRDVDFTGPTAIVVGAEMDGIFPETVDAADGTIIVPMMGMVQSLNVSVATALILFEAQRQREAAGLYDNCRLDEETVDRLKFEWAHPKIAPIYSRKKESYPELDEEGNLIL